MFVAFFSQIFQKRKAVLSWAILSQPELIPYMPFPGPK